MLLTDVRIDETLWDEATPERRLELGQAVRDLLDEHRVGLAAPHVLRLRLDGADVVLETAPSDGGAPLCIVLPMSALGPHFQEYIGICRDLGRVSESTHSPRLEALDIAKRLSHDEAAETLVTLLAPLGADHATCRRLFTLLVTLHFDTTRLTLPHHRR